MPVQECVVLTMHSCLAVIVLGWRSRIFESSFCYFLNQIILEKIYSQKKTFDWTISLNAEILPGLLPTKMCKI